MRRCACGYMLAIVGCSVLASGRQQQEIVATVALARYISLGSSASMLGYAALLVYTYAGCRRHVAHFVDVALR
jgi:hypothetical protein